MPDPNPTPSPFTTAKIMARYRDLDFAEATPRERMYLDIGWLCGRIARLEELLLANGIRVPEE